MITLEKTPRQKHHEAIAAIAMRHGFTFDQVMTKARRLPKKLVAARTEIYCYLNDRDGPAWSLPRIAEFFERDHTTIMFHLGNAGPELRARFKLSVKALDRRKMRREAREAAI